MEHPNFTYICFNPTENVFAEPLEPFLLRQQTIDGQISLIRYMKSHVKSEHSTVFRNVEKELVWLMGDFTFDANSVHSEEYLRKLKSYIVNTYIAMSVENIERLLKAVIRAVVKLKFGYGLVGHFRTTFKTNQERLKFIQDWCGDLSTIHGSFIEAFDVYEQVRHIVVHSDQIIKPTDDKLKTNSPRFKETFVVENENGKQRIYIDSMLAGTVISNLTQLGFSVFESLSRKENLPIKYDRQ